jgi:hypothetical protein
MPEHREPSQPPPRPRLRRPVWTVAAGAAAIAVAAIVAARQPPGWYSERLATADAAAVDRDARRLVTTVAGLRAAAAQPGPWGVAVREREINAWLSVDLPRNHAAVLPAGWSEPRIRLEPGRILVAARTTAGPFAGLVTCDIEVRLRAVNQLECAVAAARLGAIPLPSGPFVHRLAALLGRVGFVTEPRRLDGRPVVVVSLGGRGVAIEGLSVDSGELVVAGTTEQLR